MSSSTGTDLVGSTRLVCTGEVAHLTDWNTVGSGVVIDETIWCFGVLPCGSGRSRHVRMTRPGGGRCWSDDAPNR